MSPFVRILIERTNVKFTLYHINESCDGLEYLSLFCSKISRSLEFSNPSECTKHLNITLNQTLPFYFRIKFDHKQ